MRLRSRPPGVSGETLRGTHERCAGRAAWYGHTCDACWVPLLVAAVAAAGEDGSVGVPETGAVEVATGVIEGVCLATTTIFYGAQFRHYRASMADDDGEHKRESNYEDSMDAKGTERVSKWMEEEEEEGGGGEWLGPAPSLGV